MDDPLYTIECSEKLKVMKLKTLVADKFSPNFRFLGRPGYFGHELTQKSKTCREFFFMVFNNLTKNHSNWWWSCQVTVLIWHGMTQLHMYQLVN